MNPSIPRAAWRESGLSLVEGLLALAIATIMLSALIHLLIESQKELRAKNQAEQIQAFQRVAAQYYTTNRTSLLDAMDIDSAGEADLYCQVGVPADGQGTPSHSAARHTCTIDASLLKARQLLPRSYSETTARGEQLIAVFRRIYDAQGLATENVEMVVLTALSDTANFARDDARHAENLTVAAHLGATGGVVPDRDRGHCKALRSAGIREICGNGWRLDLADFLDEAQLQAFDALLPQ